MVPEGARGGDVISIPVPPGGFNVAGVMCSTLPSLPGMTVRFARSIIYGTVSVRYTVSQRERNRHQSPKPGDDPIIELPQLIIQAHAILKQQAAAMGCNAVLGITLNIVIDSSGIASELKTAFVTVTGTPCFLVADVKIEC